MKSSVVPKLSASGATLAQAVHQQLCRDIVAGRLKLGEQLRPKELGERYQASLTVVREALTRLTSERLVETRPHRGFFVVSLSEEQFRDFLFVRTEVESIALRLTIEHGDLEWESRLISAHHTLARTPFFVNGETFCSDAFVAAFADYFHALYSGGNSPRLIEICNSLFNETAAYRIISHTLLVRKGIDIKEDYRRWMEAAIGRKVDVAIGILRHLYARAIPLYHEIGMFARHTPTTAPAAPVAEL